MSKSGLLQLSLAIPHWSRSDYGKDEVDQIERSHEDDDNEEQHVKWTVGAYHLHTHVQSAAEKTSPLKLSAVFLVTALNFNMKFHKLSTCPHLHK